MWKGRRMKIKTFSGIMLTLLLTETLMLALFVGMPPVTDASASPTVYATVHEYYSESDLTCTRFNVTIGVKDVTDMGAWSFGLTWNTSLLDAEYIYGYDGSMPDTANNTVWVPVDGMGFYHPDGLPALDNAKGLVKTGALCPQPLGQGLTGHFELVKIRFHIILAPPPQDIMYSCLLKLNATWTVFGDTYGNLISVNLQDGLYAYTRATIAPIPVCVDIKPGSWPNPLQLKKRGVLPVAICGTEEFDVTTIDPETVQLTLEGLGVGVSPLRWSYEDVATPYKGDPCSGHDYGADGYLDITLKFKTQEVIETLGLDAFSDRDVVILMLTGNLKEEFDGTRIMGQDCIVILHK